MALSRRARARLHQEAEGLSAEQVAERQREYLQNLAVAQEAALADNVVWAEERRLQEAEEAGRREADVRRQGQGRRVGSGWSLLKFVAFAVLAIVVLAGAIIFFTRSGKEHQEAKGPVLEERITAAEITLTEASKDAAKTQERFEQVEKRVQEVETKSTALDQKLVQVETAMISKLEKVGEQVAAVLGEVKSAKAAPVSKPRAQVSRPSSTPSVASPPPAVQSSSAPAPSAPAPSAPANIPSVEPTPYRERGTAPLLGEINMQNFPQKLSEGKIVVVKGLKEAVPSYNAEAMVAGMERAATSGKGIKEEVIPAGTILEWMVYRDGHIGRNFRLEGDAPAIKVSIVNRRKGEVYHFAFIKDCGNLVPRGTEQLPTSAPVPPAPKAEKKSASVQQAAAQPSTVNVNVNVEGSQATATSSSNGTVTAESRPQPRAYTAAFVDEPQYQQYRRPQFYSPPRPAPYNRVAAAVVPFVFSYQRQKNVFVSSPVRVARPQLIQRPVPLIQRQVRVVNRNIERNITNVSVRRNIRIIR